MAQDTTDERDDQPQTLAQAFQAALADLERATFKLGQDVHPYRTREAIYDVVRGVQGLAGVVNALMWNDTNAETTGKQRIALARFVNVYANRERLDADKLQIALFETWLQAVGAMGMKVPGNPAVLPVGYERESIAELAAAVVDRIMGTDDIATIAEAVTLWQTEGQNPVYQPSGKIDPAPSSAPSPDAATI